MTSAEKKAIQYKKLIVDVKADLDSVQTKSGRICELAQKINENKGKIPESDLMACAAYLHHFYTEIESMLERISKVIDGGAQTSGDYHRELLYSMATAIPGIRPAILSKELSEELDEYRRFRHMFRHAYGAELRWGKMKLMAQEISSIMEELNKSISMAIIFLEDLIGNLEQ